MFSCMSGVSKGIPIIVSGISYSNVYSKSAVVFSMPNATMGSREPIFAEIIAWILIVLVLIIVP